MTTLHGDLSKRAEVVTAHVPWTAVAPGVEERLLEHAGARRTAITRVAPGAELSIHGGGSVDVLVLEGDLGARYPAGLFIHERAGASYRSDGGGTALVKLRPAYGGARAVVDTRALAFAPSHTPGLWSAPLHDDVHGRVVLLRFDPGTQIDSHHHDDGEELFVLDGELVDEFGKYSSGAWVRQPPASVHRVISERGCLLFTFAHHLRDV